MEEAQAVRIGSSSETKDPLIINNEGDGRDCYLGSESRSKRWYELCSISTRMDMKRVRVTLHMLIGCKANTTCRYELFCD